MWGTSHSLALCTHNRMNQSGIAFDRGGLFGISFDTTLYTEFPGTHDHTAKDTYDRNSEVVDIQKNKIRYGDLGRNEQFFGGHMEGLSKLRSCINSLHILHGRFQGMRAHNSRLVRTFLYTRLYYFFLGTILVSCGYMAIEFLSLWHIGIPVYISQSKCGRSPKLSCSCLCSRCK